MPLVPHTAAIAIEPLIIVYDPYLKVSPSGVVNGPALVVFSGKKVLIYDRSLDNIY